MPEKLKEAVLKPKNDLLNSDEYRSFRPISNLKLMSKVIEKVVAAQLLEHLAYNELEEPLQSAYKLNHSTETALLKVQNDILIAIDNHCVSPLYYCICQPHLTLSIMNCYCNE